MCKTTSGFSFLPVSGFFTICGEYYRIGCVSSGRKRGGEPGAHGIRRLQGIGGKGRQAPRKPVIKNRRIEGVMIFRPRSARAKERPMRKQPERLTMRVPQGNLVPKSWAASNDTAYRESDPMPPPINTKSIFIIQPSFSISCRSQLRLRSFISRVL